MKKSIALRNKPRTEEDKQKMRGPRSPMSKEGKKLRSIAGKGKQSGIPKSAEHKAKISAALKNFFTINESYRLGVPLSAEHKAKISATKQTISTKVVENN